MAMWEVVDHVDLSGNGHFEDRAGVSGSMAWILDGASPVSQGNVTSAETDAVWLVNRLDHELRELSNRLEPLEKLVALAIGKTADHAKYEWRGTPEVAPSAALGVVRRVGERSEFLVLADVSVVMRTDAGVWEYIDQRVDKCTDQARRAMVAGLKDGRSFDEVSEQIRPLLAEHRRSTMNQEGGYWVASTDDSIVAHALTGALDHVEEVILASDGFMRALRLFDLVSSAEELFDPACDFTRLAHAIRHAERHDPETRAVPRWNVSDDICARRLRWVD